MTSTDSSRGSHADPSRERSPRGGGEGSGHHAEQQRKQHVLTHHSASTVRTIADAVVIKDGEPFFLCPPDGQLPIDDEHGFGLYHHDTRFLSGYELTIAGATANSLAATALTGSRAVLELTTPELRLAGGRTIGKERLAIRWTRQLNADGPRLDDRIEIHSYDPEDARLPLRLRFDAGFEDVFDVRGLLRERPGKLAEPRWEDDELVFSYGGRDGVDRGLRVSIDPPPSHAEGTSCQVDLEIPARGSAALAVRLEILERLEPGARPIERRAGRDASAGTDPRGHDTRGHMRPPPAGTDGWRAAVQTDSIALGAAMSRSLDDLLTLRGELDGWRYYAAGVPWFSTLFGRDALISAYQTLAFEPRVAAETLRLLAGRQGTREQDFRDEQPGKILHELRIGELARLREIPHTPYYGSIDATPLFLVLLARLARWTGDLGLFRELRSNVDRALDWIDRDGDPTGRGYVAYESAVEHGLVNQGWKDSGDAIVDADGNLARPPIALAEVQGYVYAAKREVAELFERDGDADRANRLRREAAELRERFERDFWSDDLGCYVLALAADGRPCQVPTSNAGQVLWSGIASEEHARTVAQRLLDDDLFAGWGIRTLSSGAKAYNPIGYHLGTIWPHDNGLIAEGFRRYGLDDEALSLFTALVEASTDFPQQRLPECFAGYDRKVFGIPVRYPIACHPQAWAAGAIPHLTVSTLGLVPDAFERRLQIVRPRLPAFVDQVSLRDVPVADATADLTFWRERGRTEARVDAVHGELDVRIEAS
jgi:glycogen debranching enzyme